MWDIKDSCNILKKLCIDAKQPLRKFDEVLKDKWSLTLFITWEYITVTILLVDIKESNFLQDFG